MGREDWRKDQLHLLEDIDLLAQRVLGDSAARPTEVCAAAPQATDPPEPAAQAAADPLMERLRRAAAAKQHADSTLSTAIRQHEAELGKVLERAHAYLRDLTEQLNIVQPVRQRPYRFHGSIAFAHLAWRHGETDYRLRAERGELRVFEKVTLRFHLAAAPLQVEREPPALEKLHEALNHWHVPFTTREVRNNRGNIIRVSFTITPDVRGYVSIAADDVQRLLRIRLHHVERFGSLDFQVPPAAFDDEAIEDLAKLLLGEPSRFMQKFKPVV